MKYLVAVRYKKSASLKHEHEIFEFKAIKDRDLFINDIKPVAVDIALSEIEEVE